MKFLIRLNVGTILVAAFLNLLMIQFSLAAPLNDGVNAISNKVTTKQLNAKNAFSFHREVLHSLMLDLYECKPDELKKSTKVSKEEYAQWVFEGPFDWKFDAIRNMQSSEAIILSFNQQYQGDRVLPLITGLYTILLQAYGGKNEFTFTEEISQKQLEEAIQSLALAEAKLQDYRQDDGTVYLDESCYKNVKQKLIKISKRLLSDSRLITNLYFDDNNPSNTSINNSINYIQL